MFLCRPTDMHKYEIGEGERLEVYSVRFSGAMLSVEIDQASMKALLSAVFQCRIP